MNNIDIESKPASGKMRNKSEKGFALVEILVAAALITITGVGLLSGMIVSSKVLIGTNTQETGKDLAVAEMEYVKSLSFNATSYSFNPGLIPAGSNYSVTVVNPPQSLQDGNLQKITVIVSRNGTQVIKIEDYKINW